MGAPDWPSDIHPESGSRVPPPARDDLDEAGRAVYDHAADPAGPSYAGLHGPTGVRLHSPRQASLLSPVSRYLRLEAGIPDRVRELLILATARELDSQFEWAAHQRAAVRVGIEPEVVEAVRAGASIDGQAAADRVVILLVREILGAHRLSSETYARAHALFGTRLLVDIVGLVGNYASTAALLCAFDVQLHPDWTPALPERPRPTA